MLYQDKGQSDKALEHLKQALTLFEEIGANREIEQIKQHIAKMRKSIKSSGGQDSDAV